MKVIRMVGPNGGGIFSEMMWSTCCGDIDSSRHPLPEGDATFFNDARRFGSEEKVKDLYRVDGDSLSWVPYSRLWNNENCNLLFAFKDRDQFLSWVYDPIWRQALHEAGAVLKILEVDERYCIIGDSQIVFIEGEETEIATVDFLHFEHNNDEVYGDV